MSVYARPAVAVALAGASLCASAHVALSESCKPSHSLPTIILKNEGVCDFNLDSLAYRGTPEEQAKCLMRGEDQTRNLGPPLENLPDALASRVGRDTGLPSRETLSAYLSKQDLERILPPIFGSRSPTPRTIIRKRRWRHIS